MPEFGPKPQEPIHENGLSLDALKFETTKGKILLNESAPAPEQDEYYSGVCDVISPEEALAMADTLRETRKDPNRKLMVGVMATRYSLNHEDGDDCPDRDTISSAFTDDPDVLNTVHYADFYNFQEKRTWKGGEQPDVLDSLEKCVEYGGENLHAIQLDLTWPKPELIKEFKEKHPNILIILQIGKIAMAEVESDPQNIADKLKEYGDSIDYALLDLSMGKGRKMTEIDVINLERILHIIQYDLPELGLSVAGGFGKELEPGDSPETMDPMAAIEKIAKAFPNISIDAQSGLKPKGAEVGFGGHTLATTPADLMKSTEYLGETASRLDGQPDSAVRTNRRPSYIAA